MSFIKRLGKGFIATMSGIEITNIGMYIVIGQNTGYLSLLFISLMFIPIIYIQQIITMITLMEKKRFHELIGTLSYGRIYYGLIYIASVLILFINLYILSLIIKNILNIHWLYIYQLILISSFVLAFNNRFRNYEKILIYLSTLLLIYVFAAILSIYHNGFKSDVIKPYISGFILLALWGAVSSPYSLVLQELTKEIDDLVPAYFYSVLIGSSIAIYGLYVGKDASFPGVFMSIPYLSNVTSIFVLVGLLSSVILASIVIHKTLYIVLKYRFNYPAKRDVTSNRLLYVYFLSQFIAPIILNIFIKKLYLKPLNVLVTTSSLIGLLSLLSLIPLLILIHKLYTLNPSSIFYKLNFIGLLTIVVVFGLSLLSF